MNLTGIKGSSKSISELLVMTAQLPELKIKTLHLERIKSMDIKQELRLESSVMDMILRKTENLEKLSICEIKTNSQLRETIVSTIPEFIERS